METKRIICKSCNGEMKADNDRNTLVCPFCGSKELIFESDQVIIEKDRNKTKKDIEFKRLQHEKDMFDVQNEHDSVEKFKKGKLSKLILVVSFFALLVTGTSFRDGRILSGLLAFLQMMVLLASWVVGMGIIKPPIKNIHYLAALVGFLLVIPVVSMMGGGGESSKEKISWPTSGLTFFLPTPSNVKTGYIYSDDDEELHIRIDGYSKENYDEYVEECKARGFDIDAKKDDTGFDAYNSDGYHLKLDHYAKKLEIELDAPMKFKDLKWDEITVFSLLPEPKSKKGHIQYEHSDSAMVYIGGTSEEDYRNYVDECKKAGFDANYEKGEDYYRADHLGANQHLSLGFEGFNTMKIDVQQKKIKNKKKEKANGGIKEEEPDNINSPSDEASESVSVKEAMDKYEEFIDEYIRFMNAYKTSGDATAMLPEYAEYMKKYSETMDAINAMEAENMNALDRAYYIEVTTRCSQKLLESASEMQ